MKGVLPDLLTRYCLLYEVIFSLYHNRTRLKKLARTKKQTIGCKINVNVDDSEQPCTSFLYKFVLCRAIEYNILLNFTKLYNHS